MQKILVLKFLVIFALVLLLMIPILMIRGVIHERQSYRDSVILDVARSWTGEQKVTGVALVIPYSIRIKKLTRDSNARSADVTSESVIEKRVKYVLPTVLDITGGLETEERYRGIYRVPVYTADLRMKGQFDVGTLATLFAGENVEEFSTPYVALGVTDIRGLTRNVSFKINGADIKPSPGSNTSVLPKGIHADVTLKGFDAPQTVPFEIAFGLQGMQSFEIAPVGERTTVSLTSPWQHPSFVGSFLPKTREVSRDGFKAEWETTYFASNMGQAFATCLAGQCDEFNGMSFGVSLVNGVDVYLKAERALKYAMLFIVLTFGTFFLFEILKALPIHAIQYGLVGAALAIFYLLLISLSEHVSFRLAYALASAGCIGLLGFYLSYVLHSVLRGAVLASALTALYGALYVLIGSEDYALVMGSGLLFGALALAMVITRNVDWYKTVPAVRPSSTA